MKNAMCYCTVHGVRQGAQEHQQNSLALGRSSHRVQNTQLQKWGCKKEPASWEQGAVLEIPVWPQLLAWSHLLWRVPQLNPNSTRNEPLCLNFKPCARHPGWCRGAVLLVLVLKCGTSGLVHVLASKKATNVELSPSHAAVSVAPEPT